MLSVGDLHAEALRRRSATIGRLSRDEFDVLVVGGGITGAAVAREAPSAGLRGALIEQGDYASGTSSRSSRLIHGGLRYVKQLRVGLVAASLEEQAALAVAAPHLVRPLPFLLPMYRGGRPSPTTVRLAMGVYRALSPAAAAAEHRALSAADVARQEPLLAADGLVGGFLHREYVTHDARLVIETVLAARERGAVTANYVRRQSLITQDGQATGVLARDTISGEEIEIRARVVVNATGPWPPAPDGRRGEAPTMSLTKGVHALLPRRCLPLRQAVAFFSSRDGRALFGIPQNGFVYLGTTETPYVGDPARVSVDRSDVEYLTEAAAQAFPCCRVAARDVVASWAGVRPLAPTRGRGGAGLSRRYVLRWSSQGVLSILGGKLTLHRRVARAALAAVERRHGWKLPRTTAAGEVDLLPGAVWTTARAEVAAELARQGLDAGAIRHLMDTYGGRASHFTPILDENPRLGQRISPGAQHLWAEAVFAVRNEMAVRPDDFPRRRTDFALSLAAAGAAMPPGFEEAWRPGAGAAVHPVSQPTPAGDQRSAI